MKSKAIILVTGILVFFAMGSLAQGVKKTEEIRIKASVQCGQCKDRIESGLAFEKGVKSSEVDLEKKEVTVKYNPAKTTPEAIRKAISKLGYDADEIQADPKAYEKLPACCKKDAQPH